MQKGFVTGVPGVHGGPTGDAVSWWGCLDVGRKWHKKLRKKGEPIPIMILVFFLIGKKNGEQQLRILCFSGVLFIAHFSEQRCFFNLAQKGFFFKEIVYRFVLFK